MKLKAMLMKFIRSLTVLLFSSHLGFNTVVLPRDFWSENACVLLNFINFIFCFIAEVFNNPSREHGNCSLYVGLERQHVLLKQVQRKKFLVREQHSEITELTAAIGKETIHVESSEHLEIL